MLGWFPDLQDDELIYSAWARYQDQRQNPRQFSALGEIFGTGVSTRAPVGLPDRLDIFMSRLPIGHRYTVMRLINRHSILPYFAPFLDRVRLDRAIKAMRGNSGMSIHNLIGVSSWIAFPKYFRFCPLCVKEDREQCGFCYWHWEHFLPGVMVCIRHKTFIEQTDTPTIGDKSVFKLFAAEGLVVDAEARPIDESNNHHLQLLRLAEDTVWIAKRPNLHFDGDISRKKYLYLLATRGLATYRGTPHSQKIVEAMMEFCPDILELFEIAIGERDTKNWIVRLLQYKEKVLSPVYHLVMMQFLGVTPKEFLELPDEPKYFGDGPWPCLNPKCEQFQKMCIDDYRLTFTHQDGKPKATFACPSCKFQYSRVGPDVSPDDNFKRQRSSPGKYPAERTGSQRSTKVDEVLLARRKAELLDILKTQPGITRSQMYELNSRACYYVRLYDVEWYESNMPDSEKPRRYWGGSSEITAKFREELETLIRETPDITRGEIHRKCRYAIRYLQNYDDPSWLASILPEPVVRITGRPRVDWATRDAATAAKLPGVADKLKADGTSEHPKQITKERILNAINAPSSIRNNIAQMPITKALLEQQVETHLQIALRRLEWATQSFHQQEIIPTRAELYTLASLHGLLDCPEIQEALYTAMATFV